MTTWNNITISNPGTLTVEALPDELKGDGAIWEDFSADDEREAIEPDHYYPGSVGREGKPEGDITIEGRSKYHADDAEAILPELSKGRRIEWFEEWDDDGPGQRVTVWENGEEVAAERKHSELVPDALHELVAELRALLPEKWEDKSPLSESAQRLVDALDPKGVKS